MNKKLQQYFNRPMWQIFLYQWIFLGILIYILYIFELSEKFNLSHLKENDILNQKKIIEKMEKTLALFPELSSLEKEIEILKLEKIYQLNEEHQKNNLKNNFYTSFNHSNTQLIHWEKQKTEIKENVIHKTWEVDINTDFYGVLYFLTELLKTRPPVLIKKIDISTKKEAFHDPGNQKKDLKVIIQITEILPLKKSITDEQ